MMSLPPEVEASYATIIDSILAQSDITTISANQIRKGLQKAVHYDLTPQKVLYKSYNSSKTHMRIKKCLCAAMQDLIKELIISRFDKYNNTPKPSTTHEGAAAAKKEEEEEESPSPARAVDSTSPNNASHTNGREDSFSESAQVPPSAIKKKRKLPTVDEDARLAARLQALENNRLRSTRGGGSKKSASVKKRRTPVKSKSQIKANDDSDLDMDEGDERKRKVNRNGGFHKPFNLSTPLSELLGGETSLSRPEVVKRIWAYVKERDLQVPNDKRYIECDDALRTVFKQDRVHMFTMNKLLNQHLYAPDE